MIEFRSFERVGEIPDATLRSLEQVPIFPSELVEAWRRYGTGLIGDDGFVRLVDPGHYLQHFPTWFTDTGSAVPFATTGMGDLFVWQPGAIRHVLYRYGTIRNVDGSVDAILGAAEDPVQLDGWLLRRQYQDGVARLGRPDLDEAFFYAPFLALGGPENPANLQRGDLAVSLSIFANMLGRASLIPGRAVDDDR